MSGPIVFISHNAVKDGKLEGFREAFGEVSVALEAEKPGTIVYLAFADEDGSRVSVVHVFPDASAMGHHLQGVQERMAKAVGFIETTGYEIYGAPRRPSSRRCTDSLTRRTFLSRCSPTTSAATCARRAGRDRSDGLVRRYASQPAASSTPATFARRGRPPRSGASDAATPRTIVDASWSGALGIGAVRARPSARDSAARACQRSRGEPSSSAISAASRARSRGLPEPLRRERAAERVSAIASYLRRWTAPSGVDRAPRPGHGVVEVARLELPARRGTRRAGR